MKNSKDFKIKLIFPCHLEGSKVFMGGYPGWAIPYGMGVLTAFLRKNGYYVEQEDLSVKINRYNHYSSVHGQRANIFNTLDHRIDDFFKPSGIDERINHFVDNILDSMHVERFNLIGFSVFSYYYFHFAILLSRRIKEQINIPIVLGGTFINLFGNLFPEGFNFVDYMVAGDGNVPLLKLIHYLQGNADISEVPNLIYRRNGDIITNHKAVQPLEDMPMPDFDGLPLRLYSSFDDQNILKHIVRIPYQVTRGCTSRCSFCNFILNYKRLEVKSYEKVVAELKKMKEKYNIRRFYFCDEAINNSPAYLEGLCDVFIRERLNIDWIVNAKIVGLNKHILTKMNKAGCNRLELGVESGSNRILKMMNKGFTAKEASEALKCSSEAGIKNTINFVTGYPHERQEDIDLTSDFIRENKKYCHSTHVTVFLLTPGADIYRNFQQHGLTNLTPTYDRFILTFDEIDGLRWEQKLQQQVHSREQIIKTIRACYPLALPRVYLRILVRMIINKILRAFPPWCGNRKIGLYILLRQVFYARRRVGI